MREGIGIDDEYQKSSDNEGDPTDSSYEDFMKFLIKLGLNVEQANIYLALMRHGSRKASEISDFLGIERSRCYKILMKMQSEGVLEIVGTSPLQYDVVSIQQIISDKLKKERGYISELEKQAPDVIHKFENLFVSRLLEPVSEMPNKFKFSFVEGLARGTEVATSITLEARRSIDLSVDQSLIGPYQGRGLIDALIQKGKEDIPIHVITNKNGRTEEGLKDLIPFLSIKVVNLPSIPNFIVADGQYVYLLIDIEDHNSKPGQKRNVKGFTIYSEVFGRDMEMLFEYLWQKSGSTRKE